MRPAQYDKLQMKAADLSAKICALRQSVMQLLNETGDPKRQKAIFGISLLMGSAERDASKIATGLDVINSD